MYRGSGSPVTPYLEDLAVELQYFRTNEISEQEATDRHDAILHIVDEMYASIHGEDPETEKNKILRLFLARIDSRKMSPTVEYKEGNSIIRFNPELAPDLQQFSQRGTEQYQEQLRYTALKMWAMGKFDRRHTTGDYPQYEGDPATVLEEINNLSQNCNKELGQCLLLTSPFPPSPE